MSGQYLATVTDGERTDYAVCSLNPATRRICAAACTVRRAQDLMAREGMPFRAERYERADLETYFPPDFPAIGASRLPQPGYARATD